MDQQPTQPQQTPSPTPAQSGGGWSVTIGAAIAILLIAGGVYYFLTQGGLVAPEGQEQAAPAQGDESVDAIEADLNSQSDANVESDLSNLEQSL